MPGPVIYLVRSWPRLSQTFVLEEVLALERRGAQLAVFALAASGEQVVHPRVASVRARVTVLTRRDQSWPARLRARARDHATVLTASPARYAATAVYALRHPGLADGYGSCTVRRGFGHAVAVTAEILRLRRAGRPPRHVHAHFAHDPALVGLLVARLTGLPFSFTGHARDLTQIPAAALVARAAAATTLVTCCEANADHIRATVPEAALPPLLVLHHGTDLTRFHPAAATGRGPVPTILSVGRLVEKKGFDDLLRALAGVRAAGTPFMCHVYGDGPMRGRLLALRDALGLRDQVRLPGACDQDRVVSALARADVFALASRPTDDGDRDGIPNVLVEAMSCGVPVITTSAGGIPELVRHEENGLVAPPGDVPALTAELQRLLQDPALRSRLGAAARRTVEEGYDVSAAARTLEAVFAQAVAS